MDSVVLKIGLAGLMHDIGKFAQGGLEVSREYRANNADLYQPFWDGYHSHQHALYTAAFIEQLADLLPSELNAPQWGEGDSFINLAAGHHRPHTPLQWIITQADRISSGQDRATFEKGEKIRVRDYRKSRLLTLFEQMDVDKDEAAKSSDEFSWCYPLQCLSAQTIFPEKIGTQDISKDGKKEYSILFDQFLQWLPRLQNRDDSVLLWAQHFDSLLCSFTALIPAARVGDVVPDVSLYDHAKTTGAIASALYLYHRHNDSLDERSIKSEGEEKFLLISGDFFGIQDFIFSEGGESAAFRSKLLRGRSFGVSLFSELAADLLCRNIGLPPMSVVLNAAGKFTIIAPHTKKARAAVHSVQDKINQWLYQISYGLASMGFTMTAASPKDFTSAAFARLWSRHKGDMEQSKAAKIDLDQFGGAVKEYLDTFDNTLEPSLCPLCGIRPSRIKAQNDRYLGEKTVACTICRDHIMLGTNLVKNARITVVTGVHQVPKNARLLQPIFGEYQVLFLTDTESEKIDADSITKIWTTEVNEDGTALTSVTSRLINGYVPVYENCDLLDDRLMDNKRNEEDLELVRQGAEDGRPKTFSDIARLALNISAEAGGKTVGTEALGVLKADVDNLGLLMGCGLPEERYTISRIATLSRQLDSFFSMYLPCFLGRDKRFSTVYTVFAGGDDLFLIGPWNKMVELTQLLREKFSAYVCENPQIHFSAGITMHKAHSPVGSLAGQSEAALTKAKDEGRNRVTIFDETVLWTRLDTLGGCVKLMESWLGCYLSSTMFYKLNELVEMAAEEKALKRDEVRLADLHCLKWRAQLQYLLARNLNSSLKGDTRNRAMKELEVLARWLDEYGGTLKIPLWHILYNRR